METNQEKIEMVNKLLNDILITERENNECDSVLPMLSDDILNTLVAHWYNERTSVCFMSENGIEVDEYLEINQETFNN